MAIMRTIGVRLRLAVDGFRRDSKEAGDDAEKMAGRIERAGKKSSKAMDDFLEESATKMAVAGAALVAVAGASVLAWAKFDKQMSEVGAVSNATGDELDQLAQAALDAGAATSFSASQAAEAEAELAKAGIATADILSGGLMGALDLAAAGTLELATAAEIAAAAMNTFGLGGEDVGHIADVLAAAANKSSAGVEDLGQGLQQVGLIAAQVNLSLDETVALLAAFADRGLKGSDGATSLKTALMRLAAPTGEAADLMAELGISMYDAQGQVVGAAEIAGQLQSALQDLAPAQRNAALNTIFGSDAIRAANILYTQGRDGIQEYIDAVDDQGAASRVAAAKLDNLAGDVERLTGSLETLFITSGKGSDGPLRTLVQGLDKLVNLAMKIPEPVRAVGIVVLGISGAALLATAATIKLRLGLANLATSAAAASAGLGRAAVAMRVFGAATSTALLALGAIMIAFEALNAMDVEVPGLSDLSHEKKMVSINAGLAAQKTRILTSALEDEVTPLRDLVQLWGILNGQLVSYDEAALDAVEAVDAVAAAFTENGFALDQVTKAGLSNRVAMERAAREAVEAADAYLKQTGDLRGAAEMLKRYEDAAVRATGATGKQLDAVKDLAAELYRMPEVKDVKIKVGYVGDGIGAAYATYYGRRWGGITEHAQSGLLREASTFPAGPTRYAFAEPATGGEAFVPKRGNTSRSMAILNQAAGWYGAQVVPQGGWYGGGGGSESTPVAVTVNMRSPSGQVLQTELVNFAIQTNRTPAQLLPNRRGR